MTLKEYCKELGKTAKEIARNCHIPYSTINDLMNAKTDVERTSFGTVCKVADYLGLGLDEFRRMFDETIRGESFLVSQIIVRNKRYFLFHQGKRVDLCKVSALNERNIGDIAAWTLRDLTTQEQLEEQNDLLLDARRHAAGRDQY